MKQTAGRTATAVRADLIRAIERRHPLTITYVSEDGGESVRTVEPFDIHTTGAGHVVVRAVERGTVRPLSLRQDRLRSYTRHRSGFTSDLSLQAVADAALLPGWPETASAVIARELAREDTEYWLDRYGEDFAAHLAA